MLALAATLAVGLAAPAAADTFCVPGSDPSCAGTAEPTVTDALNAAQANGSGRDTVRIAAKDGPYVEPFFSDSYGNPVDIVGAGATRTVLQAQDQPSTTTLRLGDPTSNVSDVGIVLPNDVYPTGLDLAGGTATRVAVTEPSGVGEGTGVLLDGDGARFEQGTVTMRTRSSDTSIGIREAAGATSTAVEDSTVTAMTGVSNVASVRRSRIVGHTGVENDFATMLVEDVLVVPPTGTIGGTGILGQAQGSGSGSTVTSSTVVHHATIAGDASATGASCQASATSEPASCSMTIDSSIVDGSGTPLVRQACGGGGFTATAQLAIDYASFDPAMVSSADTCDTTKDAGTIATGAHDLATANPGLVPGPLTNPGAYHLLTSSPAVDAGNPSLGAGESATDADGAPRAVAGYVGHAANPDMGAFEYQPHPPAPWISWSTGTIPVNGQVQLRPEGTDPDPGDRIAGYAWSIDGGAPTPGATITHRFTTAGDHLVTLTATDLTGHSASATAVVHVFSEAGATSSPALVLHVGLTAAHPRVRAGGRETFTLALTNRGSTRIAVRSIREMLPARWSYVRDSATLGGTRVSDPHRRGATRTWTSPLRRLTLVRVRQCRGHRCRTRTLLRPGRSVPIVVPAHATVRLRFVAIAPRRAGPYADAASVAAARDVTVTRLRAVTVRVTAPPRHGRRR